MKEKIAVVCTILAMLTIVLSVSVTAEAGDTQIFGNDTVTGGTTGFYGCYETCYFTSVDSGTLQYVKAYLKSGPYQEFLSYDWICTIYKINIDGTRTELATSNSIDVPSVWNWYQFDFTGDIHIDANTNYQFKFCLDTQGYIKGRSVYATIILDEEQPEYMFSGSARSYKPRTNYYIEGSFDVDGGASTIFINGIDYSIVSYNDYYWFWGYYKFTISFSDGIETLHASGTYKLYGDTYRGSWRGDLGRGSFTIQVEEI